MFHPEHRDYLTAMEVPDSAKPNQRVRALRGKVDASISGATLKTQRLLSNHS